MSKKFITLALAGIALISLSACGNDDDPTATSDEKWKMMERMFQLYE